MNDLSFYQETKDANDRLVVLENYQTYLDDAYFALEQFTKAKRIVSESKSINSRELRFIKQNVDGWSDYFQLPKKLRPVMESARWTSNKTVAMEFIGSALKSIYDVIAAIVNWIFDAIASLFGGGGGGGGGGGSSSGGGSKSNPPVAVGLSDAERKTVKDAIERAKKKPEVIEESIKEKVKKGEDTITAPSLAILGLKEDPISLKTLKEVLTNLKVFIEAKEKAMVIIGETTVKARESYYHNELKEFADVVAQGDAQIEALSKNKGIEFSEQDGAKYGLPGHIGFATFMIDGVLGISIGFKEMDGDLPLFTSSTFKPELNHTPSNRLGLGDYGSSGVVEILKQIEEIDRVMKSNVKIICKFGELGKDIKKEIRNLKEEEEEANAGFAQLSDEEKTQDQEKFDAYKKVKVEKRNMVLNLAARVAALIKLCARVNVETRRIVRAIAKDCSKPIDSAVPNT